VAWVEAMARWWCLFANAQHDFEKTREMPTTLPFPEVYQTNALASFRGKAQSTVIAACAVVSMAKGSVIRRTPCGSFAWHASWLDGAKPSRT
jgi:hypothetical protein